MQSINVDNFQFLVKFDPTKHNWVDEVLRCEIPIIFSCGECHKFEKLFYKKYDEEKLIFKVIKTNFLDEKGKTKNPLPYFMFFLKGELILQFSADSAQIQSLMDQVFDQISEFTLNEKIYNNHKKQSSGNLSSFLNNNNNTVSHSNNGIHNRSGLLNSSGSFKVKTLENN